MTEIGKQNRVREFRVSETTKNTVLDRTVRFEFRRGTVVLVLARFEGSKAGRDQRRFSSGEAASAQ